MAPAITSCSITKTTSFLLKPQCSRLSQAKQWTTYSRTEYWGLSKKKRGQSFYLPDYLTHSLAILHALLSQSLPPHREITDSLGKLGRSLSSCCVAVGSHQPREWMAKVPTHPQEFASMQLSDLQDLCPLLGSFLQPGSSPSSFQVSFFPTLLFGKPSDWSPLSSSIPSLWFLQSK